MPPVPERVPCHLADGLTTVSVALWEEPNMKRIAVACVTLVAVVAALAPAISAQTPSPTIVTELVATWQRAGTDLIDVAEAMPEQKYDYKPTPEIATFRDQLIHVAGIAQRFVDSAKGVKTEAPHHAGAMTKAEVIALLKQTLQAGKETLGSLTDAQLLDQVKFPI